MKKLMVLWLVSGLCGPARSQNVRIINKDTGAPVELATLICEDPPVHATTDLGGQADLSPFRGAGKIEIRAMGFKTLVLSYVEIEAASFRVELEISSLKLEEVVISATRWKQSSATVPLRIISIPPEEAVLQNPQTAADLLGTTGQVFIQKSQQGGGSPMIRGFATNRLLYAVDGVRMNTAIFRSGNIQNVINLDPFAIEHTEVLFGPGSVIYGSDAIGGVMSFRTLVPCLQESGGTLVSGKALARYSSADRERTGHFDVNVGWRKWALVTSFSSWEFGDLRQGSHGPEDYLKPFYVQRQDSMDHVVMQTDPLLQVPSAYSQVNLMQKLRFSPNENWDFRFGFHYSETSPYGRYDRHNRMRNGLPRYAEWNYGPQKWMMNNLEITSQSVNPAYDRLTLRLAQQSFGESRIDRSFNKDERNTQTEDVRAYSLNLDFLKSAGKSHTLYYGMEYLRNAVHSAGELTDISTGTVTGGASRYPQSEWSSLAAYLEDQVILGENLSLLAGLRYNRYDLDAEFDTGYYPFPFTTAGINHGALTGSVGLIYRPTGDWSLRLNAGTAFRSPNVDDMGKVFDSEPGAVTVPNPGLKAEYAWSLDLGIARVFDDRMKISLAGFYTYLQHAMVRRDFLLNGLDSILYQGELSRVQAIQNAAGAYVIGIQAGLELKLPEGFSFSSDLNYQKGKEELDDGSTSTLRHAAPLFGISRLSYRANRLYLQFYACYQGQRRAEDMPVEEKGKDEIYAKDSSGRNFSPAWYTLNIKAEYRLTDYLTVSAGIENLTDQRYRPYSSGISGPGRNFILSLKAGF